jgi:hypothetical protein
VVLLINSLVCNLILIIFANYMPIFDKKAKEINTKRNVYTLQKLVDNDQTFMLIINRILKPRRLNAGQ